MMVATYYTRREEVELVNDYCYYTRGDLPDVAFRRRSCDNGSTWSPAEKIPSCEHRPEGMLRRHQSAGYVDPLTNRYLSFRTEGILPRDDPLDGMKHYALYYTVSEDGGRTECVNEQVIQPGAEFDAGHPLPGLWIGKNSIMLSTLTCQPLTLPDGTILLPTNVTPLGPDGEYHNPGGGYTYSDVLVLRGKWRADKRIEWKAHKPVSGDPNRSTRGMDESTLGLLADGRVLMVIRGSNDLKEHLPGYKWFVISFDGGVTWSRPEPWRYTDGTLFYSPASCSQLLQHSSGALLWLGNICKQNPRSNAPRYPLIMGEVDRESGLLKRDSLSIVDDRGKADSESLQLSNFYAREDRQTGAVLLHMTRLFAKAQGDWTADSLLYRISVISDQ
jgi:hypothetical protein